MNATAAAPAARPQPDRFLLGILVGIAALLVAAGIGVAASRRPAAQLPADSPAGTVQRFYAALEERDYDRAYDLLSDAMSRKPTRDEFVRYNADRSGSRFGDQRRIRIDAERIGGDTATITAGVTRYYGGGGPFGGAGENTTTETFSLRREGDGWRITGLPYEYWSYPSR